MRPTCADVVDEWHLVGPSYRSHSVFKRIFAQFLNVAANHPTTVCLRGFYSEH